MVVVPDPTGAASHLLATGASHLPSRPQPAAAGLHALREPQEPIPNLPSRFHQPQEPTGRSSQPQEPEIPGRSRRSLDQ